MPRLTDLLIADDSRRKVTVRFETKTEKTARCWQWNGCHNKEGFSLLFVNGRVKQAVRVGFYLAYGRWPKVGYLLCGDAGCVRPSHFKEGPKPFLPDEIWTRRVVTPQGCWEWPGTGKNGRMRAQGGRGSVIWQGKPVLVSRLSFFLIHERWPVPNANHTCDNPSCFRPTHLYEGDQKANARDCVIRGRHWSGFKGPRPALEKQK